MSQVRSRTFTECGGSRNPAPFEHKLAQESQRGSNAPANGDLSDRRSAGEGDEIAASVVLGYN